jgi:hypothetical protein
MKQALDRTPSIPYKNLEEQFQKLIDDPIHNIEIPISRSVVVIEALDECDDKEGIKKLIRIITNAHCESPFPLRFFVTSQRDDYIEAEFGDDASTRQEDLEHWKSDGDIRKFFESRFRDIRRPKPRVADLPELTEHIETLVKKSEGLFIWAETVVRFIDNGSGLPGDLIQIALDTPPGLNSLYRQVFDAARLNENSARIIGTIMCLRTPLPISQLGRLLALGTLNICLALGGLKWIFNIPPHNDDAIQPIHASLHDFLTADDQSRQFFICHHTNILLDCLRVITVNRKDIADDDIVHYACVNWCYHFNHVLMHDGEDDLLHSQAAILMMEYLTNLMCQAAFRQWFKTLYDDGKLLEARHALGSAMSTLNVRDVFAIRQKILKPPLFKRLPGSPNNLLYALDNVKHCMHVSHPILLSMRLVADCISTRLHSECLSYRSITVKVYTDQIMTILRWQGVHCIFADK